MARRKKKRSRRVKSLPIIATVGGLSALSEMSGGQFLSETGTIQAYRQYVNHILHEYTGQSGRVPQALAQIVIGAVASRGLSKARLSPGVTFAGYRIRL